MPSRLVEIKEAMVGYDSTQTFLIGYNQTQGYFPLGLRDDMGLGFLSTLLHHYLGIPIDWAYPALVMILILSGWLLAFFTYTKSAHQPSMRNMFHILNIAMAGFVFTRGDVYIAGYTAAMAIYYMLYARWNHSIRALIHVFLIGVILVMLEMIRSRTGAVAVFTILLLLWLYHTKSTTMQKLMCSVLLVFIFLLNHTFVKHLSQQRNQWFLQHTGEQIDAGSGHPFWHSVYIGLGIVSNRHGIEYRDEIAFEKAKEIGGDSIILCSKPYEAIIQAEYMRILKLDPVFVFRAMGLKAIMVGCVLLLLMLPVMYKKQWRLLVSISPFLLMYAAAGILVYPRINYMLGALTLLVWVAAHVWTQTEEASG